MTTRRQRQTVVAGGAAVAALAARRRRRRKMRAVEVTDAVEIRRDRLWVPVISAGSRDDALFGLGYSVANDRMWQMDLLRRVALGRVSEVSGPSGLSSDRLMRLIGMPNIVDACLSVLSIDTRRALETFSAGVNARIRRGQTIEFRLARYQPDIWTPRDSIAIARLLGWIMSTTIQTDLVGEEVVQVLGNDWGDALLLGTTPERPPPDAARTRAAVVSSSSERTSLFAGSNAWAVASDRSVTGAPLLASDPHLAVVNPSLWYEAHLRAPGFNVAGMTIPGLPCIGIGRTQTFAWAFTASMVSQTILFRESLSADGTAYREGNRAVQLDRSTESIDVRDSAPDVLTIRRTERGPLLSDLQPSVAAKAFSVSWAGAAPSDDIGALLALNAAQTLDDALVVVDRVVTPTFNVIAADAAGSIACVTLGGLPVRPARPGLVDPLEHTAGAVASSARPQVIRPVDGIVSNANGPLITSNAEMTPYFGNWDASHRGTRVRALLDQRALHSPAEMLRMQTDIVSIRALDLVPSLIQHVEGHAPDWAIRDLRGWDGETSSDSRAALLVEAFLNHWARRVLALRLPEDLASNVLRTVSGAAQLGFVDRLLRGELSSWIEPFSLTELCRTVFDEVLERLQMLLGDDLGCWSWGAVHTLRYRHPLGSANARLAALVDAGPWPLGGDRTTVWMSWWDPVAPFEIGVGPSMRMVADLSRPDGLWVTNTLGQVGTPRSRHSRDQAQDFLAGRAHPSPASDPRRWLTIHPRK